MADSVTEAILEELTPPQMVELYCQLPGVTPVSRFSDRTTGKARLRLALERTEMKLARGEGGARIVPLAAVNAARGPGALQRRITVLATTNPKRPSGASHARFALYRTGMTMAEYVEAAVRTGVSRPKALKDIYHDRDHGHIAVTD